MPILRGPLRLAEGFAFIPIARRSLPIARLPFEDLRVLAAAIAATALSAGDPARARGRSPCARRWPPASA